MTESLISSSSRQLLSFAIAALVIMSLSSCNTKQKKKIAENAVDNFHVLFNDSQYREIYLQASFLQMLCMRAHQAAILV